MATHSFKDNSAQETEHRNLHSIPVPIDAEYIKTLRRKWIEYFWSLSKTPTEIKLADERASRASQMVSSNQKKALEKSLVSPKPIRPLTALYSSPRTTTRMKKVMQKMSKSRSQSPRKLNFSFCPECGFVNCALSHKEHAEKMRQRLKKLLTQHPSLKPKKRNIR